MSSHDSERLKELSSWDEAYITSLPAGEFDWLEYKASAKLGDTTWMDDVSKYVSAWGNYDGGYIVFGVSDPKEGGPIVIDGGVPENLKPDLLTWLDEVIPRLVEPPIEKITTWLVRPSGQVSAIKPEHVVVVIHIPESEIAPHQARDNKYYQRVGRRNQPLGNRAIFDIASRKRHPRLRTMILVHIGGSRESSIFWRLENIGSTLALHWKTVIQFPTEVNGTPVTIKDDGLTVNVTEDGRSYLELRILPRHLSPLFPGSDLSGSFTLQPATYEPPLEPSIENICVTTFADYMPALKEIIELSSAIRHH